MGVKITMVCKFSLEFQESQSSLDCEQAMSVDTLPSKCWPSHCDVANKTLAVQVAADSEKDNDLG